MKTMERIYFNLKSTPVEENKDLDGNKLLGSPVMPEGFLESLKLEEGDYFVAQIACASLPVRPPFPNKGYIYVFLNIDSLKPKVFYTEEEPAELIDDINSSFDEDACGDPTCLRMEIGGEEGSYRFGDVNMDIGLEGSTYLGGKLTLLEIDGFDIEKAGQESLIFGNYGMRGGHWTFLIKEADLAKGDFSKVEFVESED